MLDQTRHPDARLGGLDTLRALAIALVFAYHYRLFVAGAPIFGWAGELGWTGVDLFFVLSGYLIANQLFKGIVQGRVLSLPAFYGRRLLRTLPVFWVVLAAFFLFPAYMGGREPPPLWRFLTFTQNIQLTAGTAFSHAWSLCIEEQFYLVLPAVALVGARWLRSLKLAWIALFSLTAAAIAWRASLWELYGSSGLDYHRNIYYATLGRADELLPGVALALLKHGHPAIWAALMRRGQVLLAAGLVACGVTAWQLHIGYTFADYSYGFAMTAFGYSLVAWSFALLVAAALGPASTLARLRIPGAAQLAAWSYAIYLVHKSIGFAVMKFWLGPAGVAGDSWLAIGLVTGLSIAIGWLLYVLVETPFMRLRDRWIPDNFAGPTSTRFAAA